MLVTEYNNSKILKYYTTSPSSFTDNYRLSNAVGCSHSRAYIFYEDSVYNPGSMMGHKCKSWNDYVERDCDDDDQTPMGHSASPKLVKITRSLI